MKTSVSAIGISLAVAALAVMTVVGVHASHLGDDPAWLFDCNDTTCEDLWADARRHYLRITSGAALAGLLGWMLIGIGRPAVQDGNAPLEHDEKAVERRTGMFGAELGATLAIALGPVVAVLGGGTALGMSRPFAFAVLCGFGALMGFAVWRDLRARTGADRAAWFTAFVVVLVGALAGAVTTAALFMVLFVAAPVAAIAVSITAMLLARHGAQRWLTGRDRVPAPAVFEEEGPAPGQGGFRTAATACGVLVIVVGAVVAGWPVDAPSEDAWKYGEGRDTTGPDSGAEVPAKEGPVDGSQATSRQPEMDTPSSGQTDANAAPVPVPDDVPTCLPGQLVLGIGGWDSTTGNSHAELHARNIGEDVCALRGRPELAITQGGDPIDLRQEPLQADAHLDDPSLGAVIAPASSATSVLFWPGYRTAADLDTSQSAAVVLTRDADPIPVELEPIPGHGPVPAPFDLKDGVPGGAEIQVGTWSPRG